MFVFCLSWTVVALSGLESDLHDCCDRNLQEGTWAKESTPWRRGLIRVATTLSVVVEDEACSSSQSGLV